MRHVYNLLTVMQALIIPDLYEPADHWETVKQHLDEAGLFTTIYTYTPPRNEDVSEIVDDIAHHLVDATIVLGYGVGGRIAIQLGARQPHQLAGIVLLSTPAMKAPGFRALVLRILRVIFTPVRILIPYYFRKKLAKQFKKILARDEKKLLYLEVIEPDQSTFLAKITDPLYLLWGSDDKKVSSDVATVMSEALNYADVKHTLEIVAGGDGALHRSQPKLVANTVAAMQQV